MIQYIEIAAVYLLRLVLRVFYIFPIKKNKIIFASYHGRQYSCSPKYIFEYMVQRYGNQYQNIWALENKDCFPKEYESKNIRIIKYFSIGYFYHVMTAWYIINNVQIEPIFPLRKKQICINTWHGHAYKSCGFDITVYKKRAFSLKIFAEIRRKMTKYIISPCQNFTDCISKDFYCSKEVFLPIGIPRNDILFYNTDDVRKKIITHYSINENNRIVLYAPTYRGDNKNPENIRFSLNVEEVLNALKFKFGYNFILFYRMHYIYRSENNVSKIAISASDYPDMQELLCATDVLITDYSSCMWDFSFTYKPCFLYAPDLEKYKEERSFYTQPEEWPFSIAKTNEQFIENIKNFDKETYEQAVKQHHYNFGSYETGSATEQLCNILFKNQF
jgi:CDP-glycerol glycerophosphotransferase